MRWSDLTDIEPVKDQGARWADLAMTHEETVEDWIGSGGFLQGMGETLAGEGMPFVGGIVSSYKTADALFAAKRIEAGTDTEDDHKTLLNFHIAQTKSELRDEDWWRSAGSLTGDAIGTMTEFLATGGVGPLARKAIGKTLRKGLEDVGEKALQKSLKRKIGEKAFDIAAQSVALEALSGGENIWGRTLEDSGVWFDVDPEGRIQAEVLGHTHSFIDKLDEGLTSRLIETSAEHLGGLSKPVGAWFAKLSPIEKARSLYGSALAATAKKTGLPIAQIGEFMRRSNTVFDKAGFHGTISEIGEEFASAAGHKLAPNLKEHDMTWEEVMPSLDDLGKMAIAFPLIGGAGKLTGRAVQDLTGEVVQDLTGAVPTLQNKVEAMEAGEPVPVEAEPVDVPAEPEAELSEADTLTARAAESGADLTFEETPGGIHGVSQEEGKIVLDKALLDTPGAATHVLAHEMLHDASRNHPKVVAGAIERLKASDPEAFQAAVKEYQDAYREATGLEPPPELADEEGAAVLAEDLHAMIQHFGTPEGRAVLEEYIKEPGVLRRLINWAKEMLNRIPGVQLETRLKKLQSQVGAFPTGFEVEAAGILSDVFRHVAGPPAATTVEVADETGGTEVLAADVAGVKAATDKESVDRAPSDVEALGDLPEGQAEFSKFFGSLDAPGRREVASRVLASAQDLKVLDPVIVADAIAVMDELGGEKLSPEGFLNDQAVLSDLLASDAAGAVSAGGDGDLLALATTKLRAVVGAIRKHLPLDAGDGLAAGPALEGGPPKIHGAGVAAEVVSGVDPTGDPVETDSARSTIQDSQGEPPVVPETGVEGVVAPSDPDTVQPTEPEDKRLAVSRRRKPLKLFQFDLPEEGMVDRVRRVLQDEFIRVQRFEQEIGKRGEGVTVDESIHEALSAASSKMRGAINQLRRKFVDPIYTEIQAIVKAGGTAKDAADYLLARHAPSRNTVIAERNPEAFGDVEKTPGSGIPTSEALATVKKRESGEQAKRYKRLGSLMNRMNAWALKRRLDGDLISQEQHDQLLGQWENYMPFKTEDDSGPYATGGGFSVKGDEFQMAGGRETLPDAPIQFAIQQAFQSIERAEKNAVGLSFLNMLRAHKDQVKFSEESPEGFVSPDQLGEGQVTLKEDGKQVVISLEDELLARAIGRVGRARLPAFMRVLNKAVRFFVATRTSLSPDFMAANFVRDITAASVHINVEQGEKLARRSRRGVFKAIKAAYQVQRGNVNESDPEHKNYLEFEEAGGLIGWYITPSIAELEEEVANQARDVDPTVARRALNSARAVLDWVEAANHGIEQGIRASLFREMRLDGFSVKESGSAARNVTVDFTKKGEWSSVTNMAYVFSNAGIQGSAKILRVLKTRRGKQFAAAFVASGFASTWMNMMVGGDDDDGEAHFLRIPEHIRSSHIIVMHPNGDTPVPGGGGFYFKLPLPYGWSSFWALGGQSAEAASGRRSVAEAAITFADEAVNSWNPVGGAPDMWQFLAPTMADPLVQHATNITWSGSPIMPEQRGYGLEAPDSQRHFKSVSKMSEVLAKWANRVTGGDEIEPGIVDVSPELMDHYYDFLVGSAGASVKRAVDIPIKLMAGEVPTFSEVPVLRRFIGEPNEWFVSRTYYENRDAVERLEARVSLSTESGNRKKARELRANNAHLWKLRSALASTDKRIRDLRKKLRALPEDRQEPYAKKIDRLQRAFNKRIKESAP